jgi:hypothetical protein
MHGPMNVKLTDTSQNQTNIKQDRQCTYKRNNEASSSNHCCCGRIVSITFYKYVFLALVIQSAMRMRHIVICSLSSSTIYPSRYLIKGMISGGENFIKPKMCVFNWAIARCASKSLVTALVF